MLGLAVTGVAALMLRVWQLEGPTEEDRLPSRDWRSGLELPPGYARISKFIGGWIVVIVGLIIVALALVTPGHR